MGACLLALLQAACLPACLLGVPLWNCSGALCAEVAHLLSMVHCRERNEARALASLAFDGQALPTSAPTSPSLAAAALSPSLAHPSQRGDTAQSEV